MADEDVQVRFGAAVEGVLEKIEGLKHAIESVAAPVASLSGAFKELAEVAIAAFAIEKAEEFFDKYAEFGEKINKAGYQLGTTTTEIQQLSLFARESGSSMESLTMSMERFQLMLQRAQNSTSFQGRALHALGLSAQELVHVPVTEQIELLADAFQKLYERGVNPTSAAMPLFGRAARDIVPELVRGKEAIEESNAALEEAGGAVLPQNIEQLAGLKKQGVDAGTAFSNLGATVAAVFAPAMTGLVRVFETFAAAIKRSIDENGPFKAILDAIAASISVIDSSLAVTIAMVQSFWEAFKLGLETVGRSFIAFGKAVYAVFTGNFSDLKNIWSEFTAGISKDFKSAAKTVVEDWTTAAKTIKEAFTGAPETAPKTTKPLNIPIPDAEAIRAAQEAAAQIIKVQDLLYKSAEEKANAGVKLFRITEDQKAATLISAMERRDAVEVAALQEELVRFQRAGANPEQVQKIQDQITLIYMKSANERNKITDAALEADAKQWESFLGSFQSAWDSQLKGLLDRTTTWGQAMRSIFQSLVLDAIKWLEKLAVEKAAVGIASAVGGGPQSWIQGLVGGGAAQAANTTALTALTASVNALTVAMGGSIVSTDVAAVSTDVNTAAQEESTIATLAQTIATNANTVIQSIKTLIPGFQSGTWEVPAGGGFVHAGEIVVPPALSAAVRSGEASVGTATGGGGTLNATFNISAWDGSDVNRFLRSGGAAQFARAVAEHFDQNPSSRPRY